MSRLISLSVTDFCRIRAARINLHDGVNKVVGANGQGKSSLLNALAALLSGREIPEEPIRTGAEFAEIIGETETLTIKRKITKAGSTLVIEAKDKSAKFTKPQDMLDTLTGGKNSLLFDPSRFVRESDSPEGRRRQAEQLRQIVGLDFTELDQKRSALFGRRTSANAAADDAEAQERGMPYHEDAPTAEVSANEVLSEIDKATEHNRKIEQQAVKVIQLAGEATNAGKKVKEQEARIEELKKSLAMAEAHLRALKMAALGADDLLSDAESARDAMQLIDVTPLRSKLSGLETANQKARDNAAKVKAGNSAKLKRDAANALTKEIEALDSSRAEQMATAKFPIQGLSFDYTGVRYQGKPFTQASDAEKLRVAVAVYAARKPELKAMVLRMGSLMDKASLEALDKLAEEYGLQVLLEIVAEKDDYPVGAIVIEDGTVKTSAT